jgi:thiol-disulfide isomerase/thioredoxin
MTNKKILIIFIALLGMVVLLMLNYAGKYYYPIESKQILVDGIRPEFIDLKYYPDDPKEFPDMDIESQDIGTVSISSLHEEGEYLLLNIWATWCPPCLTELPSLMKLKQEVEAMQLNVKVEVLSIDSNASFADLQEFLTTRGLTGVQTYLDPRNSLIRKYSVPVMPSTFLVNPEGRVEIEFLGDADWSSDTVLNFLEAYTSEYR